MDETASKPLPAFGFLTALEDASYGFFGGYLILTELGRPLEFHCTTPVLPNQAQKILYGASLKEYLLGELIGQTLLAKAKLPVQAVLTDQTAMLGVTLVRPELVACVSAPTKVPEQAIEPVQAIEQEASPTGPELKLESSLLRGSDTCQWAPQELEQILAPLVSHVDLQEPFQRIHEAILEAQRMTQQSSADDHESSQAA